MFIQQLLVPAVALLSVASAQTSNPCSTKSITINSNADFAPYQNCQTLQSLIIGSEAGPDGIDISGPLQIVGSLTLKNNSKLITLQSTTLSAIGGSFVLNDVTALSTLSFSVLTKVTSINWSGLPILGSLTFPQTISSADSVVITNTFIESLDGINLNKVGLLDINNNSRLKKFETQVANISQSLNIAGNNNKLVVSFPNLIWANNMTFRDVRNLTTPSLVSVNGSLIFVNNLFTEYIAPNLTSVGDFGTSKGSFAFVGNNNLTAVSFPVTSIGGAFQVANNTNLKTISMPSLKQVGGAIDLSGSFGTPSAPALKNVVGALNIQSTVEIDCSTYWNTLKGNSVVQGKSTCISNTKEATTLDGTSTTTSTGSKTSTSKGAGASFGINEAAAGLSVIGGLLQMLL